MSERRTDNHEQPGLDVEDLGGPVPEQADWTDKLDDSGEASTDPYEKAEDILTENATLFETTDECWKVVRELQRSIIDNPNPGLAAIIKPKLTPNYRSQNVGWTHREKSRIGAAQARQLGRHNVAEARTNAYLAVQRWSRETSDWSDDAIHALAETQADKKDARKSLSTNYQIPSSLIDEDSRRFTRELQSIQQSGDLHRAYTLAYAYQTKAAHRLAAALKDETLTVPLIERLVELADDGKTNIQEFPGLLEVFAVQHEDKELQEATGAALKRTLSAGLPAQFIRDILDPAGDQKDLKLNSEVIGLVAGVHMTARAMERSAGKPIENVGGLLIAYPDLWPEALHDSFASYIETKVANMQTKLKESTKHYLQRGRLASTEYAQIKSYDNVQSGRKPTLHEVKKTVAKRKRNKKSKTGTTAANTDTEDLRGETAPRITAIGVMKQISGKKGRYFRMEPVEDIEALMALPTVADYINTYQSETSLGDTLRSCFQSLMERPFQPPATRQISRGGYSLEIEGAAQPLRRKMKRFSLKNLPGITTGSISPATRIYYDIVTIKGKAHLVIHKVFNKSEITKKQTI